MILPLVLAVEPTPGRIDGVITLEIMAIVL